MINQTMLPDEYIYRFTEKYRSFDAAIYALTIVWQYSTDTDREHYRSIMNDLRSRQSRLFDEAAKTSAALEEAKRSSI